MNYLTTTLTILFALALTLLGVLAYYGMFASVVISEEKRGPYLLVYTKHVGDYKAVGPVMDALYNDLKDNYAISSTKGFGLYYDNPREVATEKLRSIVGCIVENVTPETQTRLRKYYRVEELPATMSVATSFPYKGMPSIMLGVFKVYPKLTAYIAEKKHRQTPLMEIYDQPNARIDYIAPTGLADEVFARLMDGHKI